ncbi:MAG TPA: 4'-phosphopantetheinyl transferase superfamily protein [Candidimonas sp.]|nr:4'-phosphopantetheinyl transferase superfamily protein [Candidimonas sp.]
MSLLHPLRLAWGLPQAAAHYRADRLSSDDAHRASHPRSARAQADWEVSRALLHASRAATASSPCAESLSHSRQHAVVAHAMPGWRLGIDLECVRPRRVLDLAEWTCCAGEIAWLRAEADPQCRLRRFYILWTLKEAFIKAAGLSFPADLCLYGLDQTPGASLSLRAPLGVWHARTYAMGAGWIASVVWSPAGAGGGEEPQWAAGPASALPLIKVLGRWTAGA